MQYTCIMHAVHFLMMNLFNPQHVVTRGKIQAMLLFSLLCDDY